MLLVFAFALVVVAFFAGAFFVAVLVAVFFTGAFLAAGALVVVAFALGGALAFVAAFVGAGAFSLPVPSLIGPELPIYGSEVSNGCGADNDFALNELDSGRQRNTASRCLNGAIALVPVCRIDRSGETYPSGAQMCHSRNPSGSPCSIGQ